MWIFKLTVDLMQARGGDVMWIFKFPQL